MNPRELNYAPLKDVEDSLKKDLDGLMSEIFTMIDKKNYQNHQDKKTIELISTVMAYVEAVGYSQNKLLEDHRFAWDSYLEGVELRDQQMQNFKKWYKANHQ